MAKWFEVTVGKVVVTTFPVDAELVATPLLTHQTKAATLAKSLAHKARKKMTPQMDCKIPEKLIGILIGKGGGVKSINERLLLVPLLILIKRRGKMRMNV